MNPAPSSPANLVATSQPTRSSPGHSQRPRGRTLTHREHPTHNTRAPLARFTDRRGNPREVIVRQGLAGSVLVVDRDAVSLGDCRLVAHLSADEPVENAVLMCHSYLEEVRARSLRCRGVTEHDARTPPLAEEEDTNLACGPAVIDVELLDSRGCTYRLELVPAEMSIPALRWSRRQPLPVSSGPQPVSLREVIASLEAYEPMCTLTYRALIAHRNDAAVSTSVLGPELTRVRESPIVLSRRLREAVLAATDNERLSMSEIAVRCGRVKRDGKGNISGETSWLARRIGLLAESGQSTPSPWIHSDALALIARRGLGVSPREVELQ